MGFPDGASGKESACQCRRQKRLTFDPWAGNIPWSRKWQPTPEFLPENFHGQRSLVGYSLWGFRRARHNWAHAHIWEKYEWTCVILLCETINENTELEKNQEHLKWVSQRLVYGTPVLADASRSSWTKVPWLMKCTLESLKGESPEEPACFNLV